jgi:hypothetical protein
LLAGGYDEQRFILECCQHATHRIPQSRSGVNVHQSRPTHCLGKAVGHPDHGRFLQSSTYRESDGKFFKNVSSVEPTLPKIVVRPNSRSN